MKHPHQTAQDSKDNEINMRLLISDQKEDIQEEHNCLSDQFSRFPYMIYRLWLILTFIIVLGIESSLIFSQFRKINVGLRIGLTALSFSSLLVLLGCGEMIFAMIRKKLAFAQKSLAKFQWSLIGTILGLIFIIYYHSNESFLFEAPVKVTLPLSIIVCIFGGLAVLRAFKKNQPLARLQNSQDADFLEQNEVLATEISKYDEQLEKWPCLVYRFWLKFVIVIGVLVIVVCVINVIEQLLRNWTIGGLILSMPTICWTAFCCYEMEVVLRTKMLEKSKKALFHLKVCIFLSIIPLTISIVRYNSEFFRLQDLAFPISCLLNPWITLIGALKINKIIEQRDQFIKVSSYSGDHYL